MRRVPLSRPDQLNAFTQVMRDELIDAFDRADSDDDVRAVVVTGRGRAFCAGADLSAGSDTFNADRRRRSGATAKTIGGVPRDGGGQVSLRVAASLKPVIAAINGPTVGVGVTMTLPMDIKLAADVAEGVSAFLEKRPPRFPMRISTDLPDLGPQWPEPPDYLT